MSSRRSRLRADTSAPLRCMMYGLLAAVMFAGLAAFPSTADAVEVGEYEHVWEAQTLFSGGAGSTEQHIMDAKVEMRRNGRYFTGTVVFSDILGVDSGGSQVVSQESLVELKLTGERLEQGRAAGGTFDGTVSLIMRDAKNLERAISPAIRDELGEISVYQVQGRWGAVVETDEEGTPILDGELIFELAEGPSAPADGAPFFNRSNLAASDGLGDPQLFSVKAEVTEVEGDGTETVVVTGPAGGPQGTRLGIGDFIGFVLKGLSGAGSGGSLGVPDAESRAARALLDAEPRGATPLPENAVAIDVHLSGHYLDAKNAAAHVYATDQDFTAVGQMRRAVPGVPAMPVDQDAGIVWAERAGLVLDRQADVAGVAPLAGEVALVVAGADPAEVATVRTWYHVGIATLESPFGSILAPARGLAQDVNAAEIDPESAESDAVLAALNSPSAPPEALRVSLFAPSPENDVQSLDPSGPVGLALAAGGSIDGDRPGIDHATPAGPVRIAPEVWNGRTRDDGSLYWLAGGGALYAVTDASIEGWAFTIRRAALVDSERCGRILEFYRGG